MRSDTFRFWAAALCLVAASPALPQSGRDYVVVVGSSTVYPFSTVVAERFGRTHGMRTPKVESLGTGGGVQLFCQGLGSGYPDVVSTSRELKSEELAYCEENGVTGIVRLPIGYDGLVFASSVDAGPFLLTLHDVYLALAQRVPADASGKDLIANPHERWSHIREGLPDVPIRVFAPPPTSGTRDVLVERVMAGGCDQYPALRALRGTDPSEFVTTCHRLREDGAVVEAGENDNLVVQKILSEPGAIGIVGYSFLEQNRDRIRAASMNNIAPTFATISDQSYPVSRVLYVFAKRDHLGFIPGLKAFLEEFVSDRAAGPYGYLVERGLVPLPAAERMRALAELSRL